MEVMSFVHEAIHIMLEVSRGERSPLESMERAPKTLVYLKEPVYCQCKHSEFGSLDMKVPSRLMACRAQPGISSAAMAASMAFSNSAIVFSLDLKRWRRRVWFGSSRSVVLQSGVTIPSLIELMQ
jgi:hypothetical protein